MSSLNKKLLQGLTGGVLTLTNPDGTAITGYVSPNLQGFDVTGKATIDKIPNQSGNTGCLIATDEYLEITFDFIPWGDNDAQARGSATIPQALARGTVVGLPIIPMGPFTDGLNTNGASTQPWVYETDAGLNGKATTKYEGKITLRRYRDIGAGATAFTT